MILKQGAAIMNVGNICTRDIVVCRRDTTALDAARLIRNHHVGDLVVIDDSTGKQTPVGIITDRDIVVSVVAKEVDPAAVFVSDMMSAPLVTAFDWEDLWQVIRRMRLHGMRRMPITNDADELVGIVTFDDLVTAMSVLLTELAQVSGREKTLEEMSRK
jgi:CBS domain-containing protein